MHVRINDVVDRVAHEDFGGPYGKKTGTAEQSETPGPFFCATEIRSTMKGLIIGFRAAPFLAPVLSIVGQYGVPYFTKTLPKRDPTVEEDRTKNDNDFGRPYLINLLHGYAGFPFKGNVVWAMPPRDERAQSTGEWRATGGGYNVEVFKLAAALATAAGSVTTGSAVDIGSIDPVYGAGAFPDGELPGIYTTGQAAARQVVDIFTPLTLASTIPSGTNISASWSKRFQRWMLLGTGCA